MPVKKEYHSFLCKDCEIDFYVSFKTRVSCPKCADSIYLEYKSNIWLERPFNYKRPWTDEEDEIILTGVRIGQTHRELSQIVDRTENAVRRRLQQIRKKENLNANHLPKV